MKLLTRLTASITAEADRVVSRIENHDAIAAAAVRRAREAVTTARVRHARWLRHEERQREALATLERDEQRWTERARSSAAVDEANALACLEQRRLCRIRLSDATKALREHERVRAELAERLSVLESRLAELIHRRESLRSRESIVRASEVLDTVSTDRDGGIDDVFDRWEIRIADTDHDVSQTDALSAGHGTSELQRRYEASERRSQLQAELGALLDESPPAAASSDTQTADRTESGHE